MYSKEITTFTGIIAATAGLVTLKMLGILNWHWIVVLLPVLLLLTGALMFTIWIFMESDELDEDDLAELDCYEKIHERKTEKRRQVVNVTENRRQAVNV